MRKYGLAIVAAAGVVAFCSVPDGGRGAIYSPWFKTPGGWAYCTEPRASEFAFGFLCFSTSTGRWIGVSNAGKRTVVATGRDSRWVGFERRGTETAMGIWADDRIGEAWAVCRVGRRYLQCQVGGRPDVRFWMKPNGAFRIYH